MPKQFEATMGVSIVDKLSEWKNKPANDIHTIEVKGAASALITLCDHTACVSETCTETVMGMLIDISKMDNESALYNIALSSLASVINSSRLDCHNCLNTDCKHRDPEITAPRRTGKGTLRSVPKDTGVDKK